VIIQKTLNDIYTIHFSYLQMNDVMRIIKEADLTIHSQQFDTECSIEVAIRKTDVNRVMARVNKLEGVKTTYKYTA
jgi:putative IMPACT (imprinted ancient) family translation regulator